MPSLSTVLLQEMERFDRLITVISTSLEQLQKAIKGEIVMSQDLDSMYLSFLNTQVPDLWARVAYPSLKPLFSWFADLVKRVEFMRSWLTQGQPATFWLPGFFFPQGFMTGTLQTFARKYKTAIDKLNFGYQVMKESTDDLKVPPKVPPCLAITHLGWSVCVRTFHGGGKVGHNGPTHGGAAARSDVRAGAADPLRPCARVPVAGRHLLLSCVQDLGSRGRPLHHRPIHQLCCVHRPPDGKELGLLDAEGDRNSLPA